MSAAGVLVLVALCVMVLAGLMWRASTDVKREKISLPGSFMGMGIYVSLLLLAAGSLLAASIIWLVQLLLR